MNRTLSDTLPSDGDLVARAQQGDSAAFGELVTRHQDRVYLTCYRMCHNHSDALDMAQSAFVKAYQALPRFEARANFFTWLFRIAMNVAITQRRSAARRGAISLSALEDEPGSSTAAEWRDDPSRGIRKRDLSRRLEIALGELDPEFRAAVLLKDVEELDYVTIAEILAVPVGTVKSRIHRGRTLLRELLADYEEMDDSV